MLFACCGVRLLRLSEGAVGVNAQDLFIGKLLGLGLLEVYFSHRGLDTGADIPILKVFKRKLSVQLRCEFEWPAAQALVKVIFPFSLARLRLFCRLLL